MRQALEMALEALERSVVTCFDQRSHDEVMGRPEHFVNRAITAIKEALAQPEHEFVRGECVKCGASIERQEPVAWLCKRKDGHFDVLSDQTCTKCFPVYTHPESEQNDKFCDANCVWTDHHPDCKLAQPEKQSVTWNDKIGGIGFKEPMPNANYKVTATVAPQRTWVDINTNQILDVYQEVLKEWRGAHQVNGQIAFARAIEAKIKEINT